MSTKTAQEFVDDRKTKIAKGLRIRMKDIKRDTDRIFTIEQSAFLICKHLNKQKQPFKIFIFERISADKHNNLVAYDTWEKADSKYSTIEYRFGYFIIGQIGRMKDKWTWGQFCAMIGHDDFKELIKIAEKEKVIL